MKLIDKIKDILGIEHHPLGTTRIVEMENGDFVVQVWDTWVDWPCDVRGHEWDIAEFVSKGKTVHCRTDSLDAARKLEALYLKYMKDNRDKNIIKRVCEE